MSSIKTHLKNYGESTSVKGVSKVIRSKYYALKFIWLLACLGGATLAITQLVMIVSSYLDYSTTTQISQCSGCSPHFPDVTICNLNPLALVSSFEELLQFDEYLEILHNMEGLEDKHVGEFRDRLQEGETLSGLFYETYYSLAGYFQNMNETDLLQKVGNNHLAASLVSYCEWYDWQEGIYTKEDCIDQSLFFFVTPDYSVCTTIHLNSTLSNNTEVKGFEALLFLNDFNKEFMVGYDHNILKSQARGARVLIHSPNSLPEIRKGFNIAPGHEVSIHLEAKETTRLASPYSECSDEEFLEPDVDAPSDGSGGSQISRFIYNDHDAVSLCQQMEVVKKCGCFHPNLPVTRYMKSNNQVPGCLMLIYANKSKPLTEVSDDEFDFETCARHVDCYRLQSEAEEEQGTLTDSCQFRQPCKQKSYSHRVYQSPWPHEAYQLAFYCRHINSSREKCMNYGEYSGHPDLAEYFEEYGFILEQSLNEDADVTFENLEDENLIARNFIQLKVYFLERNVHVYNDVPKVTAAYLTGSIGGILNLWIGVTFFTLIELVDFVYTVLVDCWPKRGKKEEKQDNKVSPFDK